MYMVKLYTANEWSKTHKRRRTKLYIHIRSHGCVDLSDSLPFVHCINTLKIVIIIKIGLEGSTTKRGTLRNTRQVAHYMSEVFT